MNRGWRRAGLARLLALALAVPAALAGGLLVATPAEAVEDAGVTALATTPTPCNDNGADDYTSGYAAVYRARSWLNPKVPYSQLRCYENRYGDYRTDCSGFVAMGWGIGGSGSAWWTGNFGDKTTAISRSALEPGDALLRHTGDPSQNHVAMFVRWADSAETSPVVIEQTGDDAIEGTVERTWSASKASVYTPVRYDKRIPTREVASVYGVLSDNRLTYTAIASGTGDRLKTTLSTATLGFTPKAMATLNFNTLLITSTAGELYRVDIITNNTGVAFYPPVRLFTGGWTHDHLSYDGSGYLFGLVSSSGALRRYAITAAKPAASNITSNTLIATGGFTLKTLTTAGPDRITGTVADGRLLTYKINGVNSWVPAELKDSTWQVFTHLLSPGGGIYYARGTDGSMRYYFDLTPYDGNGADLGYHAMVDSGGWTQKLLSAEPFPG